MVSPGDISGFFTTGWWSNFSVIGTILGWLFGAAAILGVFVVCYFLLQYKIPVIYFPVRGDSTKEGVSIGRPKKDRARRIKIKGIEHIKLLLARKTIKNVPFEYEYNDGFFFLRKSSDEFEAIQRPVIGNPSVTLNVPDTGLQLWALLRSQQTRKRFTDEDFQKKTTVYICRGYIWLLNLCWTCYMDELCHK